MKSLFYSIASYEDNSTFINWMAAKADALPSKEFIPDIDAKAVEEFLLSEGFRVLARGTNLRGESLHDFLFEEDAKTTKNIKFFYNNVKACGVYMSSFKKCKSYSVGGKAGANREIAEVGLFYFESSDIDNIRKGIRKQICSNLKFDHRNNIHFLVQDGSSFYIEEVKMPKKTELDVRQNYGESFIPIDTRLREFLTSDAVGLVLLHGEPGTGKTTYIKSLLGWLDKKVIYIPPHLVASICEPAFLTFLLKQSNFVLVIEDAEEVIATREHGERASGVTNLLNLTDGILGDCVRVQVICTFNSKLDAIDPALRRKGRLAAEHKFGKLNVSDANHLLKILGKDKVTEEPMTLAEIYGCDVENFSGQTEKRAIGFGKS